jgi:hypothetical protein
MHVVKLVAVAMVSIALLGCSDESGVEYAPASGVLTVGGKPIEGAQIVLAMENVSADGRKPTSRGVTDANGRFQLKTLTPEKELIDGAVVGTHRVMITTRLLEQDARGATRVTREELLNELYTRGDELSVEIPASGVDNLKFDLPSKK